MKRWLLSILFLFLGQAVIYGQGDSILLNRLTRPVVNCELVATNCQHIIGSLPIIQLDSIRLFLAQWEKYCGESEPIKRAKILLSIYDGTYTDSINAEYFLHTMRKYDYRVRFSKQKNYLLEYENNKTYFDYTPLNGSFDLWSLALARSLVGSQKRNSSQYLFCMIFCDSIPSVEKLIRTKAFGENYLVNKTRPTFTIVQVISGLWIPTGKMARNFGPNPLFGLNFGTPIRPKLRVDAGIHIAVLMNDKYFKMRTGDTIVQADGKVCFMFGAWFSREFTVTSKMYLDVVVGGAYSRIDTDIKKPRKPSDDKDSYYGVGTADSFLGFAIRRKVYRQQNVGLQFCYHFAPYEYFDENLPTPIGNRFITSALTYRF